MRGTRALPPASVIGASVRLSPRSVAPTRTVREKKGWRDSVSWIFRTASSSEVSPAAVSAATASTSMSPPQHDVEQRWVPSKAATSDMEAEGKDGTWW